MYRAVHKPINFYKMRESYFLLNSTHLCNQHLDQEIEYYQHLETLLGSLSITTHPSR